LNYTLKFDFKPIHTQLKHDATQSALMLSDIVCPSVCNVQVS